MSSLGENASRMPFFAPELARVFKLEEAYKKAGLKNPLKRALDQVRMWPTSFIPLTACRFPNHR